MTPAEEYAALDERDIVTRLREYDPDVSAVQVVRDAADEIERLRGAVEAVGNLALDYENEHTRHPLNEGEPECPGCWASDIRRALLLPERPF